MAKFIAMTLEGGSYRGVEILTRGSLAEMFRPQNRDVPLDFGFEIGLNWMLGRPSVAHGGRVLRHDGGSPHFFSIVVVLPDTG
jgi:CubicO group peptidase (beta-lactamase class C family)